jgi:hypothetical protein
MATKKPSFFQTRATLDKNLVVGNIVKCIYNGEPRTIEIERLEEEHDNVFGYQTQLGERQPRTFKISKIHASEVIGQFEATGF